MIYLFVYNHSSFDINDFLGNYFTWVYNCNFDIYFFIIYTYYNNLTVFLIYSNKRDNYLGERNMYLNTYFDNIFNQTARTNHGVSNRLLLICDIMGSFVLRN